MWEPGELGEEAPKRTPAWLPAVAVVSDPRYPTSRAATGGDESGHVKGAIGALQAISIFDGPSGRDEGLEEVGLALSSLVATLAAKPGAIPESRSVLQEYFRIRLGSMESAVALFQAASICRGCIEDLRFAPVAGSDLCRLLGAMVQVLDDLRDGSGCESSVSADLVTSDVQALSIEHRWMRRWILAHQFHALCNVHATISIASAIEHFGQGELPACSKALRTAAIYVHGSGSARAHALSLPAAFYQDAIRPTMVPPHSPVRLSGRMHLEYRMYRTQIQRLLRELPQTFDQLQARDADLASAREALFNADLIESEHHVCLIEPLVGSSRSLIQPPGSRDNAVSSLRAIRNRRAATYRPYVRYGDRATPDPDTAPSRTVRTDGKVGI
jgi:hypothetical protein